MRTTGITLASLLFLLAPQGRVAAPAPAQDPSRKALARIDGELAIVESGATLADILDVLAPAAGRKVMAKKEVVPKIRSTIVTLSEPFRVPVAKSADLLESLFMSHDYLFIPPTARDMAWQVIDTRGPDRLVLRSSATIIQPNEIDAYSARAIVVSVVLPVRHTNAREIAASLRPYYPDNALDTLTNVGASNDLLLMGMGPSVAKMAAMVAKIDVEAPGDAMRAPAVGTLQASVQALTARIENLEKEVEALKKK
jgi:hypothetical protein